MTSRVRHVWVTAEDKIFLERMARHRRTSLSAVIRQIIAEWPPRKDHSLRIAFAIEDKDFEKAMKKAKRENTSLSEVVRRGAR